ncbi:DUF3530 family protein [uncultured Amphritea sp.]|uniref:DUF3530 family protein n=1 Tax=uncultured Amphritea sp. TaxID=981605 RepID=UPI00260B302E|nr:DUF3530 family protein [uncultured Amphritea sp.]
MKLIKPLIFTLFISSAMGSAISFAADLPTAEKNGAESSDSSASNNSEANSADRMVPDFSQQQQEDLALALAHNIETEVIWLDLNGQKQLALLQQAATATPAGTVMIFSDQSTSADWPAIVHPLRTQLTKFGWNTLSITLPDLPPPPIPKRTLPTLQDRKQIQTPTDAANSQTTETAQSTDQKNVKTEVSNPDSASAAEKMKEYQKSISELGQDAAKQLADAKGDLKIILGVGESATWAMHYFMQDETQANRFLVLLDPTPVMNENAPNLLQMITEIKAPVIDLWFSNNSYKQERATLRKRAASRSGNKEYRQFRLNQQSNDPRREPLWLTRQLRGILKTYILTAEQPEAPAAQAIELTPGQ